ncbi:MAG: amidohydrolase [Anaerovoracaceae bacterium]
MKVIIKNGVCETMDKGEVKDFIIIEDGIITKTGNSKDLANYIDDETEIIDARGKTVMPGIIDNHFHLVASAINSRSIDISAARSMEEVGNLIRNRCNSIDNEFVLAVNFEWQAVGLKACPSRKEIDKLINDKPVVIISRDSHLILLNSRAMLFFNTPFALPGAMADENGMPTGVFQKQAGVTLYCNIMKSFSDKYCNEAIEELMSQIHQNGITTIGAMEGGNMGVPKEVNEEAEFVFKNKDGYPLGIELFYQTYDINKIKKMKLNRIGGALYIDGTIGCRSAAMSFNYADDETTKGLHFIDKDFLNKFVLECYRQNIQTALDAIGDEAIRWCIEAHEYAASFVGKSLCRHRIEHCELVTREQMARINDLGLVLSMQPTYEYYWGGKGKMYEEKLGEFYKTTNPFRAILDSGIKVCGGSDVTEMNPFMGMHYAVNPPIKEHGVEIYEAMEMYTSNGAYGLFLENKVGILKEGMNGDVIILDRNLRECEKSEIKETKVLATIKDGEIVYIDKDLLC